MDSEPLVSLVIPVYNVKDYVAACVGSVLGQDYRNIECICVDDGSTDGSGKILDELAATDSRLVVIHQTNAGVSAARNAGLEQVHGEFVSFVDSDDMIEKDFLKPSLAAFRSFSDLDVWMGQLMWVDPDNRRIDENQPMTLAYNTTCPLDEFLSGPVRYYLYSVCAKLFKASVVKSPQYRFMPNVTLGEDAAFMTKVYSAARRVIVEQRFVYRRRCLSSSLIHARTGFREDRLLNLKDLQAFAKESGREGKMERQIASMALGAFASVMRGASEQDVREYVRKITSHPDFGSCIVGPIIRAAPLKFRLVGLVMLVLPKSLVAAALIWGWKLKHRIR